MRMLFGASAAMAEEAAAIASATKEIRPSKVSMNSLPCDAPGAIAYCPRVATPAEGPGTRALTVLECTFASSSRVGKTALSARPALRADRSERIGARLILDRHP